jgi:mannose-1-phosphate guanylyltransferase/mannose-6-phosphate isomerase
MNNHTLDNVNRDHIARAATAGVAIRTGAALAAPAGLARVPITASLDAPLTPVILAGGAGTRLWPLSREQYPKQLIDLLGTDTLLQATVRRTVGLAAPYTMAAPLVVCAQEHGAATVQQLRGCGMEASFILEPTRRNTAPALTLAAATLTAGGKDAVMVAMPADHAIADVAAFQRAIAAGAAHAQAGAVVTLGVPPTRPDTGFGYIRLGEALGEGAHRVARFVEKPPLEQAIRYATSGEYWWNCGIFIVSARVWLSLVNALQPSMFEACMAACEGGAREGTFFRPDAQAFAQGPSESIDYAIMERLVAEELTPAVVVPLDAGWSDLGSWDAVWEALEKDADGNVAKGRVVFEGSSSSFAHAQGRLVACVGVNDIVVVETDDAVLVADRAHVQDVKALVTRMKAQAAPEADAHRKVQRPWGYYDSIDRGERFQVKRIVVQPGCRLSLQMHHHRAEHWVVVRGTALVTRGNEQFLVSENESTYIPLGVHHRLENPGKFPLEIIEIQSGAYLGEDDIVRFEDTYGRA